MVLQNFFFKIKNYINKSKDKEDYIFKEINTLRQSCHSAHNKINDLEYKINELNQQINYLLSLF